MKRYLIFGLTIGALVLGACDKSSNNSGGGSAGGGGKSGSGGGGSGSGGGAGKLSAADSALLKAEEDKCSNTAISKPFDSRYIMTENHNGAFCTTKCQIFTSTESYCRGLQDEALNSNCAKEQRNKDYLDICKDRI